MSQAGPRIRWIDASIAVPAFRGFVTGHTAPLFRLWQPGETVPWILESRMPRTLGRESHDSDPETLRSRAEQWLDEAERGGQPLSDQGKNH
jgi:hypothetical protein